MTTDDSILIDCFDDRLSEQDDPEAWTAFLATIGEEFIERYRTNGGTKSWFLRIGTCSHWWRSHQARWTVSGGFTWPVGYSANGWPGLPAFDWSVILSYNGEHWKQVEKFSGNRQVVLRVAVPARTARHRQAAIHTVWSTSHEPIFYGFRNVGGRWRCVAASDERTHGRMVDVKLKTEQS
jgi:hypothetical protein